MLNYNSIYPVIPEDIDYVLNFAVVKTGDFDYDLAANGEGVGNLMLRCRKAKAFVHFSSTAVYEYCGLEPRAEDAPLGDNHRVMFPTYSISKIAAETVCRFVAHQNKIPTTIARLSVPYGDNGGWMYFHMLMMQQNKPDDYVIATGETNSLEDFVNSAFGCVGLN